MKVILAHDQLNQYGGAEKTLAEICKIYPEAPIFTLIHEKDSFLDSLFAGKTIIQSWIGKYGLLKRWFKWFLFFLPSMVESFVIPKDTRLLLSSCSAFIKGIVTQVNTLHVCYCHTPTRFLWSDAHEYIHDLPYNNFIKVVLRMLFPFLRIWDFLAAQRVDYFIANSQFIAQRIKKYYHRDAFVIYPPVDVEKFTLPISQNPDYFLIGGRLRPYKRFDIAIEACNKLGVKLKIFGTGEHEAYLRSIASPYIEFVGNITDEEKAKLFAGCKAFINPQEEDFGITMVEALASGRPVLAYKAGGACEIIQSGVTGEFFEEQCWQDLADCIIHFDETIYQSEIIRAYGQTFNAKRFRDEMQQYINSLI